ncbi:hypothetical protein PR048_024717 [Dryococelus australis]|uniref:HTH CENPB-type domain-containing protein n=1 Tax=Dryococelus australis TaxID=614101 RepID=A0ABQ9GPD7_9NEOP|nr:hypothetical protein PR048_024717 [Dryococelus australis]
MVLSRWHGRRGNGVHRGRHFCTAGTVVSDYELPISRDIQFVVMLLSKPARTTYKSLTLSEIIAVIKEEIKLKKTGKEHEDQKIQKWTNFKQARDQKIPVSGPLIRAKAEQFASDLGKNYFKDSHGWLDGFKSENGDVDAQEANEWKTDLLEMISDRDPKNIFIVDETGLFFRCTPEKTMTFKGENCSGGKLSKDGITTLLVGANMDGSETLALLITGKSANPRGVKNVKSKPVEYEVNRKIRTTCELFKKWLVKLNTKMSKQKREVLLFIDNCMAHKSIPVLENVKVVFFPPNMTSIVQPMDQGVIKNCTHFYRQLNEKVKIDLQASRMCNRAWEIVKSETIANCFKKVGFTQRRNENNIRDQNHEDNN